MRVTQNSKFGRNYHRKPAEDFHCKLHFSRHPEQREQDRALMALFGLAFERVPGISFYRLCGPELREVGAP